MADTKDASTDMWKAHAKVLHELLEHHIKEEEDQLFEERGTLFPRTTTCDGRCLPHEKERIAEAVTIAVKTYPVTLPEMAMVAADAGIGLPDWTITSPSPAGSPG